MRTRLFYATCAVMVLCLGCQRASTQRGAEKTAPRPGSTAYSQQYVRDLWPMEKSAPLGDDNAALWRKRSEILSGMAVRARDRADGMREEYGQAEDAFQMAQKNWLKAIRRRRAKGNIVAVPLFAQSANQYQHAVQLWRSIPCESAEQG